MESYGEDGYEHEYNGEYTDTEGEEAPLNTPQLTRATRVGKKVTDSFKIPPHPQSEDPMEVAGPAGQLVVREPDLWGDSPHGYPQLFMATQISPSREFGKFQSVGYPRFQGAFSAASVPISRLGGISRKSLN